jgi:hypothetical protein
VSGIDPGLAAADVACGRSPRLVTDRKLVGAVRFFYVEREDTTVEAVTFDAAGLPEAADRLVPLAEPGEVLSPPPKGSTFGRVAMATAVAETARESREALDAAQGALNISSASQLCRRRTHQIVDGLTDTRQTLVVTALAVS